MSKAKAGVAFLDIGGTREPIYKVTDCAENHIHVRIKSTQMPSEIDLTFKTPEDAYDFAEAIMRAYDRTIPKK